MGWSAALSRQWPRITETRKTEKGTNKIRRIRCILFILSGRTAWLSL